MADEKLSRPFEQELNPDMLRDTTRGYLSKWLSDTEFGLWHENVGEDGTLTPPILVRTKGASLVPIEKSQLTVLNIGFSEEISPASHERSPNFYPTHPTDRSLNVYISGVKSEQNRVYEGAGFKADSYEFIEGSTMFQWFGNWLDEGDRTVRLPFPDYLKGHLEMRFQELLDAIRIKQPRIDLSLFQHAVYNEIFRVYAEAENNKEVILVKSGKK